ncbi:MAG: hypothetical protein Q9227_004421 [Pyrenula ochraceoflavens]
MEKESFVVSTSTTTADLHVSLHPLVLLTVSDQITRHKLRKQSNLVVGALLGQQIGREITIEHAFECLIYQANDQSTRLHDDWFQSRLQQYRDVHKDPPLDLVGWFTVTPPSGPTSACIPIHSQIVNNNEAALLVAFHPSELSDSASSTSDVSAKLPITVYETVQELDNAGATKDRDQKATAMQIDGEDPVPFKIRPVHYSIETEETEMIGINYVAKGSGNASMSSSEATSSHQPQSSSRLPSGQKSSRRIASNSISASSEDSSGQKGTTFADTREELVLSTSEADLVASLGTRLNSVRMLESRIRLLQKFLQSLPSTYLSDASFQNQYLPEKEAAHVRSIAALLKKLSLLTPRTSLGSDSTSDTTSNAVATAQRAGVLPASLAQTNDTKLVDMLSDLTSSIQSASEMGRKFATVDSARHHTRGKKNPALSGFGGNGLGGFNSGGTASIMDEGYDGDGPMAFG